MEIIMVIIFFQVKSEELCQPSTGTTGKPSSELGWVVGLILPPPPAVVSSEMAENMRERLHVLVLVSGYLKWEPEGKVWTCRCRRWVLSDRMDPAFFNSCLLNKSDRLFCFCWVPVILLQTLITFVNAFFCTRSREASWGIKEKVKILSIKEVQITVIRGLSTLNFATFFHYRPATVIKVTVIIVALVVIVTWRKENSVAGHTVA